jgi:hypothetical protein
VLPKSKVSPLEKGGLRGIFLRTNNQISRCLDDENLTTTYRLSCRLNSNPSPGFVGTASSPVHRHRHFFE